MAIWICLFIGGVRNRKRGFAWEQRKQADNWATEIEGIVGVQFLMPFFANNNAPKWRGSKIVFLMSRDMIPEPSQNKFSKFYNHQVDPQGPPPWENYFRHPVGVLKFCPSVFARTWGYFFRRSSIRQFGRSDAYMEIVELLIGIWCCQIFRLHRHIVMLDFLLDITADTFCRFSQGVLVTSALSTGRSLEKLLKGNKKTSVSALLLKVCNCCQCFLMSYHVSPCLTTFPHVSSCFVWSCLANRFASSHWAFWLLTRVAVSCCLWWLHVAAK